MRRAAKLGAVLLALALAGITTLPAAAEERITLGTGGQASANLWPTLIAIDKGFFAAEGLQADILYVQSSSALVQQLTAGSLGVSVSTGLADPLHAIAMGAPISIVRLELQAPPFDLVGKPDIKTIKGLKDKLISLGGAKDITHIYIERMLTANGIKDGDYDMVFAGSTGARTSALLAGAVDAAILLPPFNFQAEAKGFNSLGLTVDYVKDLPFSATVVNNAWAAAHKDTLAKLLRAIDKSVAWFDDAANRAEAVRILQTASRLSREDVAKSYDFFRNGNFFEPSGKVSRSKLDGLAKAMQSLGDMPGTFDFDKAILPGVTQIAN
jgi:ABC-type nitrate/sulfonate/bicarbonate transport system substrate-binding protein